MLIHENKHILSQVTCLMKDAKEAKRHKKQADFTVWHGNFLIFIRFLCWPIFILCSRRGFCSYEEKKEKIEPKIKGKLNMLVRKSKKQRG
jgi:hypothetical protein